MEGADTMKTATREAQIEALENRLNELSNTITARIDNEPEFGGSPEHRVMCFEFRHLKGQGHRLIEVA